MDAGLPLRLVQFTSSGFRHPPPSARPTLLIQNRTPLFAVERAPIPHPGGPARTGERGAKRCGVLWSQAQARSRFARNADRKTSAQCATAGRTPPAEPSTKHRAVSRRARLLAHNSMSAVEPGCESSATHLLEIRQNPFGHRLQRLEHPFARRRTRLEFHRAHRIAKLDSPSQNLSRFSRD